MKNIEELQDWMDILNVGGRAHPEKSNAQESRKYRNPADSYEYPAEIERKKKLKQQRRQEQKWRVK